MSAVVWFFWLEFSSFVLYGWINPCSKGQIIFNVLQEFFFSVTVWVDDVFLSSISLHHGVVGSCKTNNVYLTCILNDKVQQLMNGCLSPSLTSFKKFFFFESDIIQYKFRMFLSSLNLIVNSILIFIIIFFY